VDFLVYVKSCFELLLGNSSICCEDFFGFFLEYFLEQSCWLGPDALSVSWVMKPV